MPRMEECLTQDYRAISRFLRHPDLPEGIRAAVVDKDRAPRWSPPSLPEVDDDAVAAFLAPLGEHDLTLPSRS
jgi:hypothetical protein